MHDTRYEVGGRLERGGVDDGVALVLLWRCCGVAVALLLPWWWRW
jgi:hypothetical protein